MVFQLLNRITYLENKLKNLEIAFTKFKRFGKRKDAVVDKQVITKTVKSSSIEKNLKHVDSKTVSSKDTPLKGKILVLGDSHTRNYAELLRQQPCSDKYNILNICKPNAYFENVKTTTV
ncbi:hypothetical protein QE152_g38008 [Popillia japonica]|uniref:Transposase n=1 Tax=Popillia japonica TaxID=7064 RepID=A0AAW1I8E3_POPJA